MPSRSPAPHRLALASLPPLLMRVRQPAKQPFGRDAPRWDGQLWVGRADRSCESRV